MVKLQFFSGKQHFYSYFQNPSENSDAGLSLTPLSLPELSLRCVQGSYSFKVNSLVETEPLSIETSE